MLGKKAPKTTKSKKSKKMTYHIPWPIIWEQPFQRASILNKTN